MKSRHEENVLLCPKCGFSTNREEVEIGISATATSFDHGSGSVLKVLDTDKAPDALPTTILIVPSVGTILRFGGCCKQDRQTKPPLNFIDVPSVTTLGETIHDKIDN